MKTGHENGKWSVSYPQHNMFIEAYKDAPPDNKAPLLRQLTWKLKHDENWFRYKYPLTVAFQSKLCKQMSRFVNILSFSMFSFIFRTFREISNGHRIGFYQIKGNVGRGNFSNVKMAIHSLTKGEKGSKAIL